MKIKLSDYVFKFLGGAGVKDVFLLAGGGSMHLVDSLGARGDIEYVCCLHEQAAVIAAEAYGQYTNHLGVALVTTGPGGTNAITGIAGAWIDSTPMLVISGQVKRQDLLGRVGVRQMGIQEVDIVSLVAPITNYAATVVEPEKIRYHLEKALHLATTGRKGPVWLDIPLDVQGSTIEENKLERYEVPAVEYDRRQIESQAKHTLKLLAQAQRPAILLGNGVRSSGCLDDFYQLIERLKIPVLTTWKAADLIQETHPLYAGKPGSIGQRGANFTQQNSDWLLTLGARLDLCQVAHNYPNFARAARKIVVDIDGAEIDKLKTFGMPVDIEVQADVGIFLRRLLDLFDEQPLGDYHDWLDRCRRWKDRYPVVLSDHKDTSGPVNPYALIDSLSEIMLPDDILVPGSSGACAEVGQQAFRLKKGQRILNTPGLGAMGFGLPATLGACLASGKRRTIGLVGDGGVQLNIQELETLSRLQLPIKLLIMNNSGYGSIKATQTSHFDGRFVGCNRQSGLTLPDICRVAEAYGLQTIRIENQKNLVGKLREVIQTEGTVICDILVDPDIPTSPRVSSRVLKDGRIVSSPLEDLWPFLPRSEFSENMVITPLEE